MQNMQNISQLFSRRKTKKLHKISESESSINSRTCLGHLVLFMFLSMVTINEQQPDPSAVWIDQ